MELDLFATRSLERMAYHGPDSGHIALIERDSTQQATFPDQDFLPLEHPPNAGETLKLVTPRGLLEHNRTYAIVFRPRLSFFNGASEHPDEIEHSYIVSLSPLRTINTAEHREWLEVEVKETLDVASVTDVAPPRLQQGHDFTTGFFDAPPDMVVIYQDWVCCSLTNNIPEYEMIIRMIEGVAHLVLCTEARHDFDPYGYDLFHCGNLILKQATLDQIMSAKRAFDFRDGRLELR